MKHWLWAFALSGAIGAHASPPEWVAATVVKVEPARSRVILNHARIASIDMDAMTMPFKVEPGVNLKRFKPGDKVRFTVANKDDHLVVQSMEKAK